MPAAAARARKSPTACGRVRKHQRAGEHGAQKNLQAAVATNIVEGAPAEALRRRRLPGEGAREARERMQDELRCPGGSGGEQDPFGGRAAAARRAAPDSAAVVR